MEKRIYELWHDTYHTWTFFSTDIQSAREKAKKVCKERVWKYQGVKPLLAAQKYDWAIARTTPYTDSGVKRMSCARCGDKASAQWNVCADKGKFRPICTDCDIELNALVLDWFGHPMKDELMNAYATDQLSNRTQASNEAKPNEHKAVDPATLYDQIHLDELNMRDDIHD